MEGSAFTQELDVELDAHDGDAPTDPLTDPFGQDGMGDFQQGDDPLAAETEDLPNAEGEKIGPTVHPDNDAAEVARAAAVDAATQVPPAAVGTDGLPNPRLNPVSQREQAVAAVAEGGASVDPPPAAQETQAQAQEVSPAAQDAAAPAASDSSSSPTPASATAGQAEDAQPSDEKVPSDDAEVPDATKTHRRYLLFAPNGDGTFTEVSWRENKDGEMVTSGGKKQTVCLARGQEDALAWGWRALGAPDQGCSLVAVAAGYFQVRHVGPDREPPKHPRLKIK